jgi:hypothetical protein
MGQYKVPQNVEAEDKIIGPLTFKQFIYALIGVAWAGLAFALLRRVPAVMIIIGLPPTLLFLLLAFYTRDGQNFEQLLIAMVGFFSQARKRLWVKEEVIESFRVEPNPVVAEQSQRNPNDVRSELDKLASMIDSRGWNEPVSPESALQPAVTDQRLVSPSVPAEPAEPTADMLDLSGSPLAQNLSQLIEEAAQDVRQEAIDQMTARPHKTAQPAPQISTSVTTPNPNDILNLATERDDLTVSQLAATANRAPLQEGQSVDLRNNASQTK